MDVAVNGNGFGSNKDNVTVEFGTDDCVVKSVEMTKIICTAPALADGSYNVVVSNLIFSSFSCWGRLYVLRFNFTHNIFIAETY